MHDDDQATGSEHDRIDQLQFTVNELSKRVDELAARLDTHHTTQANRAPASSIKPPTTPVVKPLTKPLVSPVPRPDPNALDTKPVYNL